MGRTKKKSGPLGKALINSANRKTKKTYSERHTTDPYDLSNSVRMDSIIEQNDLTEFLSYATLANKEFAASHDESLTLIVQDQPQVFAVNPLSQQLEGETEEDARRRREKIETTNLEIPRRPQWTIEMSAEELHEKEKETFLNWRRNLANFEQETDATLTPYEKNLHMWRQLWRVIERSDVIVQIVDCRNPLMFRSKDLEKYVHEIDSDKMNILLVNKSDLLTAKQRFKWAKHLRTNQGLKVIFFSAFLEQDKINNTTHSKEELLQMQQDMLDKFDISEYVDPGEEDWTHIYTREELLCYFKSLMKNLVPKLREKQRVRAELIKMSREKLKQEQEEKKKSKKKRRARRSDEDDDGDHNDTVGAVSGGGETGGEVAANTTTTARAVVSKTAMKKAKKSSKLAAASDGQNDNDNIDDDDIYEIDDPNNKVVVGMVGYPNVGKSSVINTLCGLKKVAVGSTPGKTKHFQTLPIGRHVMLCDCPGLVFPSMRTTKEDMVCDGILPIDQMKDYRPPIGLVCQRIPRRVFELLYGIDFDSYKNKRITEVQKTLRLKHSQYQNKPLTVDELLTAFAVSRGLMAQKGVPNYPGAARVILKDYVAGKILYCHPPPSDRLGFNEGNAFDEDDFDEEEEYDEEDEEEVEGDEFSDDDGEYFTESEDEADDIDELLDSDGEIAEDMEAILRNKAIQQFNKENVHSTLLDEREQKLREKRRKNLKKKKKQVEHATEGDDEEEEELTEEQIEFLNHSTQDLEIEPVISAPQKIRMEDLTPKQRKRKMLILKKK